MFWTLVTTDKLCIKTRKKNTSILIYVDFLRFTVHRREASAAPPPKGMGNEKAQLQFCLSNGLVAQLQQLNEQHAPRAIHWDKLSACTYSQGQTQKQGHKATAKLGTVKRFPCTPTTKVQRFLYISGCVQKAKIGLTSHINTQTRLVSFHCSL